MRTTLIMLLAVAVLAGRHSLDRLYVFGYLFGVWDIFYYIGLSVFSGWPTSLLTWDVLFLIPIPWIAPVLYPILVSLCLITVFLVHEALQAKGRILKLARWEWVVVSAGALVIIASLCWHWRVATEGTMPTTFPYWIFIAGFLAGVLPFIRAALSAGRR